MDSKLAKKIVFEVRLAGWLCLLPASGMLFLYKLTQGTGFLWGIGLLSSWPPTSWPRQQLIAGKSRLLSCAGL
ncbi:Putative uncharacterized protein [Lactobacillus equicursoris DSM 19284 = JCM 14600 = CIP 110162]|nr:Putative uncharacterized protein [Lactobacillus equicursoris DSM 19284 = JCM 14600 = CIP 110162]